MFLLSSYHVILEINIAKWLLIKNKLIPPLKNLKKVGLPKVYQKQQGIPKATTKNMSDIKHS